MNRSALPLAVHVITVRGTMSPAHNPGVPTATEMVALYQEAA